MSNGPHDTLAPDVVARLRDRARRLAAPEQEQVTIATVHTGGQIYLEFQLMQASYALPLDAVQEVIGLRSVVLAPNSPAHLIGLTRLRGKVLAIVDLRRYWQPGAEGYADSNVAVIVRQSDVEFGLICNEVNGLFELEANELLPVPANVPTPVAECLRGLTGRETMLLAPDKLVERPGFCIRQEA